MIDGRDDYIEDIFLSIYSRLSPKISENQAVGAAEIIVDGVVLPLILNCNKEQEANDRNNNILHDELGQASKEIDRLKACLLDAANKMPTHTLRDKYISLCSGKR